MAATRYRADIDGLRAIAVVPVICYHLHIAGFGGGYVGVDIFFVISGFLIGQGIIREVDGGTFSLSNFYERRFRRIMPALVGVMILTTIASCMLLTPRALLEYGKSLAASAVSAANFWFLADSGYFAGRAESKPLLHLWSLAVEEQFYLFAPLLLPFIMRRWPSRLTVILIVIAAISLVIGSIGAFRFPNSTFYMLHTRAWELILGILASRVPVAAIDVGRRRGLITAAGFAGIALGFVACSFRPPFPGLAALPSTMGAALLIVAGIGGASPGARLLAARPMRGVGLISYSLYLFHWPLIVLAQQGLLIRLDTAPQKATVLALTFVLSVLSWRFVERPFRTPARVSRLAIFRLTASSVATLLAVAGGLIAAQGVPQRWSPQNQAILAFEDYHKDAAMRVGTCMLDAGTVRMHYDLHACLPTDTSRPRVLILGDSYAGDSWYGLDHVMRGSAVGQITAAGCRPSFLDKYVKMPRCRVMRAAAQRAILTWRPQLVIVAHRWISIDPAILPGYIAALQSMGVRVLVAGPRPDFDVSVPSLLVHSAGGASTALRSHLAGDRIPLDQALAVEAGKLGVRYLSLHRFLCGAEGWPCMLMADAHTPMMFDPGHMTMAGSIRLAHAYLGADPALVRGP